MFLILLNRLSGLMPLEFTDERSCYAGLRFTSVSFITTLKYPSPESVQRNTAKGFSKTPFPISVLMAEGTKCQKWKIRSAEVLASREVIVLCIGE